MRTNFRSLVLIGLGCALAVGIAACGSSGSSSSSQTASASGASSGGSGASQIAAAQKFTSQYLKVPAHITVSTPLKAAPPRGKTVAFLQCDVSQCATNGDGVREAAAALGWTVKTIPYQSANPATLISAFQQALREKPVATIVGAEGYPTWSSVVPAYQKAGVPIIALDAPAPTNKTIIGDLGGNSRYVQAGQIIANWFIADSKGKGDALVWTVPEYQVLATWASSIQSTVTKNCSGCKTTVLNSSAADLVNGQVTQEIVSAVKRDPSIKYVLLCDTGFVPDLPEALKTAGVTGVSIAGDSGVAANEQDLLNGSESALVALPLREAGWTTVDMAARHLEGMTFPPDDGGMVTQILTKQTVGTPSDDYQEPSNYEQQFKRLWHVG